MQYPKKITTHFFAHMFWNVVAKNFPIIRTILANSKYSTMSQRILAESIVSHPQPTVICANEKVIQNSVDKFLKGSSTDPAQNILIRSECDTLDYRVVQLKNGIRIMLISDPTYKQLPGSQDFEDSGAESDDTKSDDSDYSCASSKGNKKIAAICVGVRVGSMQDPKQIQGMAHMLEHLMFMGSEKYPAVNAIDEYLASRDGYMNACTDLEYTLYELRVDRQYLKKTIDIIGNAFVSPLLNLENICKEIEPIDAEFIEASNDDDSRVEILLSHLSEPDHPLNRFFWGNKKSLIEDPKANNVDVQKEVRLFHQKYYKPENIVVVVQSQESLDNLEKWTSSTFSLVKDHEAVQKDDDYYKGVPLPFTKHQSLFNKLYHVQSIDFGTRLLVHWLLPPVLKQYLESPLDYWATLIGYEGKGSLISELRDKNLAMDIYTQSDMFCFHNNHLFCLFVIDLHLTEIGAANLEEVVQLLNQYLQTLQKAGAQETFFKEKQFISLQAFNKKSEKNSLTYTKELTKNMLFFPLEHVLTASSLFYHFDKKILDDFGAQLEPQKANYMVLDKKLKNGLEINVEPWMQVYYQSEKLPEKWFLAEPDSKSNPFHYPEPNKFMATDFDLLCEKLPLDCNERKHGDLPTKIIDEKHLVVWHKTDFKYRLPKASINIHLISPFAETSLKNVAMSTILQDYLKLVLKKDTYDAHEACLHWDLKQSFYGFNLSVAGFDQKLSELANMILERFIDLEFCEEILESVRNDLVRYYSNQIQEPETLCKELFCKSLIELYFTSSELIPETETITKKDLIVYKEKLLSNISLEVLVQGNINIKKTIEFSKRLKAMFKIDAKTDPPMDKIKLRVARMQPRGNKIRVLTLVNTNKVSSVECYQQIGPVDIKSDCYLQLFQDIIDEHCFNLLRTYEGLGYSVGCNNQTMFGILGFTLFVACDAQKLDCTHVQSRLENFMLVHCRDFIDNLLTSKDFDKFVQSLIARKLAPDLSLKKEVSRNWDEITSYDYCFERKKILVAQLKKARLKDFRKWVNQNIFLAWDQSKTLSVQVVGNGKPALEECLTIKDSEPISVDSICKKIQYLKSKNPAIGGFVSDVETFRKSLEFYPPQPPYKDCV